MQEKYKKTLLKNTVVDKQCKGYLESTADKAELIEINHIIQNRKETPLHSYINLDEMLERTNNKRKAVK